MANVVEWTPLSSSQERAIHRAACQIVLAAVRRESPELSDPDLSGAATRPVMGAFVTLKRNGQLRGCIGSLAEYDVTMSGIHAEITGEPLPLVKALMQSGRRTATEDSRFSPVQLSELSELTVDVSLLFNFQQVTCPPDSRHEHIVIGQHGIKIHCRGRSAIFLPVVPVEQKWDVLTYLEQLCRKAGLPIGAWRDPEAVLIRFEGRMIEGPFESDLLQGMSAPTSSVSAAPSPIPVRQLASFVTQNIRTLIQGGIPGAFPANLPDVECQGLALAVSIGPQNRAVFSSFPAGGRLPLQMTLLNLSQSAANAVRQSGIAVPDLRDLQADVLVLNNMRRCGTVDRANPDQIDPRLHTLMVTEPGRMSWVYHNGTSTSELLQAALRLGEFSPESRAEVLIGETACSTSTMWGNSLPRNLAGQSVRQPAVAGTFYPSDPVQLKQMVIDCLDGPPVPQESRPAAMIPHAGLVYSGRIAAQTLRHFRFPSTIIILSPRHTRSGAAWALAPHTHWQIPGATLASDLDWMQRLSQGIDGLQMDAAAHAKEHGIEVELPFLARLAPQSRIVGITIGGGQLEDCLRFGQQLGALLRGHAEPPLLLISSDMNHFATDEENRRLDELALKAMESCDPSVLYQTVMDNRISMCGVLPAVIVMEALRSQGKLRTMQRTGYATSADVSGDRTRVVGYAGMLLG